VTLDLPPLPVVAQSAVESPVPPPTSRKRLRTPGYVMLGVAGLLAAGTAVAYAEGVSARNQFEADNDSNSSLRNQAATWRTVAYTGDVVTGVTVGVGVLLIVLGFSSPAEARHGRTANVLPF
jgi:hypothetical protein